MLRKRMSRGTALLTALFLVAVTTLMIVGGATYVTTHNTRAQGDSSYAAAIQLAEAGVNYELWYLSRNGAGSAHQLSNPYTGTINGVDGNFTVGVTSDPAGGASTWSSGQNMYIVATGTVNGVSRKMKLMGKAGGGSGFDLFGSYGMFGVQSVTITNDLNLSASLGSNGPINITSGSNFRISGTIDKCGSGSSLSYPSWYKWDTYLNDLTTNRVRSLSTQNYPTVDALVLSAFPGQGWSYLKDTTANRANGQIKMYKATYTTLPAARPDAVWTVSCIDMTNANIQSISKAQNGGTDLGMATDCTLVFPPGDYYFQSWNQSGNKRFIVDNASGPVRIWMDSANKSIATSDSMSGSGGIWYFTGSNPAQGFRFFYNKNGTLDLTGNTATGGFYCVNAAGNAKVTNSGSCTINGSLIANVINLSATTIINAPAGGVSNPSADPGSAPAYYGFDSNWQELPIKSGGVVFSDGTKN